MPIRVVLGEDSVIVREGIRAWPQGDPAIELAAAVGDYSSLSDACDRGEDGPTAGQEQHPPSPSR